MTDIPDWAKDRACALVSAEVKMSGTPAAYLNALARFVAEHEEEPVDPLLIEAREICAKSCESINAPPGRLDPATLYRSGDMDISTNLQNVLAALRRGIELAKAGDNK